MLVMFNEFLYWAIFRDECLSVYLHASAGLTLKASSLPLPEIEQPSTSLRALAFIN
jgi:hypothetical protein